MDGSNTDEFGMSWGGPAGQGPWTGTDDCNDGIDIDGC
jgi:hypothetical protein